MRICFLLFLVLVTSVAGWAQSGITISGKAVDILTNEPLQFASVGIKEKSIGTITNLQGDFDFHIPSEYRNEILVISMLGYKNYEAPVWSIMNETAPIIKMEKSFCSELFSTLNFVNCYLEESFLRHSYILQDYDIFTNNIKSLVFRSSLFTLHYLSFTIILWKFIFN